MEKGPVPCGSLLEMLGTRVSAGPSNKTKMGQVNKKCAAWRLNTSSPRISNPMENKFSVPCTEIMGTHL